MLSVFNTALEERAAARIILSESEKAPRDRPQPPDLRAQALVMTGRWWT
jgi:hypothetical protein